MSTRLKLAFTCHFLAMIILAAFGVIYLLRPEFMPYHSEAVGMTWNEVSPPFRVLILALMKAVGIGCIAFVAVEMVILLIPFRQGARWARWIIPLGGFIFGSGALFVMLYVHVKTTASPPWIAPVAGMVLLVAGFFISMERKKKVDS